MSMVGSLLKARYYPHHSFLDAKLGYNPRSIWRSLLAGGVVLEKGVRWHVGVGDKINVWGDNWLPK